MKDKLIILIISLMMLLTSCAVNPDTQDTTTPMERNYVTTEVTYSESIAQYGFRLNMDFTATKFAKYYFEAGIEDEEREVCIETTDNLLSNQSFQGVQPEIYIFTRDRYDYKYIDRHKLYSSTQDWKSVEYLTDVLLVTYGEPVHYGTAFGYANYLAKSYNLNSYDGKFTTPSVSDIRDLNYLCFNESFTTSNDVAVAKGLACDFVESYINQHREQAFQQLLTAHSNYADTKTFFETNLKQMKQYQDLFHLDDYNHDLDIVFTKPIDASKTSFYQSINHRIHLYNVDSLMHEYIHALTMPTYSMQNWQVEGFTRYFSYYYDFYGMAFLNQDYNNTPNIPELKYIHEYLATIDRPIDIAKDYPELENAAVYSRSWTNPNENYLTGSSFVQYLVTQYGEEAVINSIYGNGNSLPKAYAELVKAWNEYIESEYAGYSKCN